MKKPDFIHFIETYIKKPDTPHTRNSQISYLGIVLIMHFRIHNSAMT